MDGANTIAYWDAARVETLTHALSAHAHYWAEQVKLCELPDDLEDALLAAREVKSALAAIRELSR